MSLWWWIILAPLAYAFFLFTVGLSARIGAVGWYSGKDDVANRNARKSQCERFDEERQVEIHGDGE